jgi:hypothetical protein
MKMPVTTWKVPCSKIASLYEPNWRLYDFCDD